MGLLLADELVQGEGQVLLQCVLVSLLGFIFALLRGLENGVVSAAELCLEVAPYTMNGASRSSGLFHVVLALAVKFVFEFGAEIGAFEGLGEEISLKSLIFEVLADICETLLAVLQGADEGVKDAFRFILLR